MIKKVLISVSKQRMKNKKDSFARGLMQTCLSYTPHT